MAQATSGSDPEEESDIPGDECEHEYESESTGRIQQPKEVGWEWCGCMVPPNWKQLMVDLATDWMFRYVSRRLIHIYGIYWQETESFFHLQKYTSIQWLPLDLRGFSTRRTTRIIDKWQEKDPNLKKLSLYDIHHCGYKTRRDGVVYLDIIYQNKWFIDFNLDLSKKKIYFFRGTFENTKQGEMALRKTAIAMAQRINLVYLAWYKMNTLMPKSIEPCEIPIISWKHNTPRWKFIPIEPKQIQSKNDNSHNSNKKRIQPITNPNPPSDGLRRSTRLAKKRDDQKQSSNNRTQLNKHGLAMQRWLKNEI